MLSRLQQIILEACVDRGGCCSRRAIAHQLFQASLADERYQQTIVTRSVERLIARGLIVGRGTKTKEKLFIETICVTPAGRRAILGIQKKRQTPLPLKDR